MEETIPLRSLAGTPSCNVMINHHMDSRYWLDFKPRKGDVLVCTFGKTGTTWMQQIVATLLECSHTTSTITPAAATTAPISSITAGAALGVPPDQYNLHMTFPWVDMCPGADTQPDKAPPPFQRQNKMPMIEALPGRRCLKTHLPADSVPYYPELKYVYVVRDLRDVALSLYNHLSSLTDVGLQSLGPSFTPMPPTFEEFYHPFIKDGSPLWPLYAHFQGYFDLRAKLPNLRLVHFADLKKDLEGQMRRLAAFLEIELPETLWPQAVEQCTFEYMKSHERFFEAPPAMLKQGSFIHKGNSRWREAYTPDMVREYEEAATANLTPACKHYVETGELPEQ